MFWFRGASHFQKLIFDIGKLYSSDVKYSIEMHMDKAYIGEYDLKKLEENCNPCDCQTDSRPCAQKMICGEKR